MIFPTISAIRRRGYLNCGVEGTMPGFSLVEPSGRCSGFALDLCHALAAPMVCASRRSSFTTARAFWWQPPAATAISLNCAVARSAWSAAPPRSSPGRLDNLDTWVRTAPGAIRAGGHVGEIYERNLGPGSPLRLERGRNRLRHAGGLLWSPPFR
ncbi:MULTISPECIES: hypothetical protein [unclassified Synechococcus]|uniref:hypothetical protein n=1 Tax=unclassified Synechococcus TaxID=2626047 RepID=UPI00006995CB|nr:MULTISPECIES: hypothetical protein [unclassified Synechococcus]EAQ74384.1 polar amino acid transport system substrate-binding proetin [Synechococcus sp. WH 5701]WFN60160.1 hypothetical protein N4320_06240 [Synechococcus sp. CCFWC 502]